MNTEKTSSLFEELKHPFVWTKAEDRETVLANVNEPIWHRFLEEAETHFAKSGELTRPQFPVWCHDGDLDEVMAVCVLAYVRNDPKLWHWVGDWMREALAFYREILPVWREHRYAVMRGEPYEGCSSNTRQSFEGFVRGGCYWVEAGMSSVMFHLLDQLEAYAPDELNQSEKIGLLEAIGDYADRYAFHEERLKYNNRALWANSAILLAGIARPDGRTGEILRFQAERRHAELRSAFLDDGFHIEGAPDYHLMAADGLLCYLLTASNLAGGESVFEGISGQGPFEQYPDFTEIVRAYLKTVIPGPTLWNHARGCSVSTPVTVRPALVAAWRNSRDSELGWLLRERMGNVDPNPYKTPLNVTNAALLGLGHYQPLLNFWLFREVDQCHSPKSTYDNMSGYGTVFSRSSWGSDASCVTARFGYEGTGKGHRDHGHVTAAVAGVELLKDPFPRYGPEALNTALFHNTVILDECEPKAVVGLVQTETNAEGVDACLILNSGGEEPNRHLLHDPAEETNYWFDNQPTDPDHCFQRAVIHLHGHGLILVDRVVGESKRCIDWFFHSDIPMQGYDSDAKTRETVYQRQRRIRIFPAPRIPMSFSGPTVSLESGQAKVWNYATDKLVNASFQAIPLDQTMSVDFGHHIHSSGEMPDGTPQHYEEDYYLRARSESGSARAVWAVSWGESPLDVDTHTDGDRVKLKVRCGGQDTRIEVDFKDGRLTIE